MLTQIKVPAHDDVPVSIVIEYEGIPSEVEIYEVDCGEKSGSIIVSVEQAKKLRDGLTELLQKLGAEA